MSVLSIVTVEPRLVPDSIIPDTEVEVIIVTKIIDVVVVGVVIAKSLGPAPES